MTITISDLRTGWLNIARRMQSVARSQGHAIITIRVMVNANGDPVLWMEPQMTRFEPRVIDVVTLLRMLTGENSPTPDKIDS